LFSFVDPAKLPPEVFAGRHEDPTNSLEIQSKRESIMRYERQIELYGARIQSLYSDVNVRQDVIRFKVSDLVQRADGSEQLVRAYRPDRDAVEVTPCANTYHLNVVVVEREEGSASAVVMGRARVVLGKQGAKRVEGGPVRTPQRRGFEAEEV